MKVEWTHSRAKKLQNQTETIHKKNIENLIWLNSSSQMSSASDVY